MPGVVARPWTLETTTTDPRGRRERLAARGDDELDREHVDEERPGPGLGRHLAHASQRLHRGTVHDTGDHVLVGEGADSSAQCVAVGQVELRS